MQYEKCVGETFTWRVKMGTAIMQCIFIFVILLLIKENNNKGKKLY